MTIHNSQHARRPADFYPTLDAPDVVRVLLEYVDLEGMVIWEPHAGAGHLVKALRDQGLEVIASDLQAYQPIPGLDVNISKGVDFLNAPPPRNVDAIVMNPPYGRGTIDRHVEHALDLMFDNLGVVIVLARSDWTYGKSRQPLVTDDGFMMKIELGWRLRWVEGTTVSGKHNYALHVWDYGFEDEVVGPQLRHGYR